MNDPMGLMVIEGTPHGIEAAKAAGMYHVGHHEYLLNSSVNFLKYVSSQLSSNAQAHASTA